VKDQQGESIVTSSSPSSLVSNLGATRQISSSMDGNEESKEDEDEEEQSPPPDNQTLLRLLELHEKVSFLWMLF